MPTEHRDAVTDVLLVRHGEVVAPDLEHPHPLLGGQGDPPLSPLGRVQAEAVGRRLRDAGLDAVYVTTLRRTVETAQPQPLLEPPVSGRGSSATCANSTSAGGRTGSSSSAWPRGTRSPRGSWPSCGGISSPVRSPLRPSPPGSARRCSGSRPCTLASGSPSSRTVIAQALALATDSLPFAFLSGRNASLSQVVLAGARWTVRRFNDTAHLADDSPGSASR